MYNNKHKRRFASTHASIAEPSTKHSEFRIMKAALRPIQRTKCSVRFEGCGVTCGVWRVACGVWRVACGVWRVACVPDAEAHKHT